MAKIIGEHIVEDLKVPIRFIDYVIHLFPQLPTRNSVKKTIKRKELLLNGIEASTGEWLKVGDEIQLLDLENKLPKPFPLDVEIVYEDDFLAIVNKPPGIKVNGNEYRTLENALVGKLTPSNQQDAWKWAKPVHRLDAATRGLVLFSKTSGVHIQLGELFEERKVKKTYHAIVVGEPSQKVGEIRSIIDGRKALSIFNVIETVNSLRNGKLSLVELEPKTGRTHQLRIHCTEMGFPIVGDKLYGEKGKTLLHKGLFLAATGLSFVCPNSQKEIRVQLNVPRKFIKYLDREKVNFTKYN